MEEPTKLPEPSKGNDQSNRSTEYDRGFYAGGITGFFIAILVMAFLYLKKL